MIRGFLTVGGWTLLSRVLGFARDILIARFLGTGAVAEAFFVAFSLPNMFRRFFAEGAFNMAFVPLYAKKLEADGAEADAFARDAVAGMVVILTLLSVLGIVFMPALVLAMASGFADDARFGLAVEYGRIAFPYIFLISLAALVSGVLNSNGRFLAAAAAPAFLNIVFIAALAALWFFPGLYPKATPVPALPYGLGPRLGRAGGWCRPACPRLVGGATGGAQAPAPPPAAAHAGSQAPPGDRRARPPWPAAWCRSTCSSGATWPAGSTARIAWLSYADRLYQLPLGLVGIAIGVVLLPDLSRRVRAEDAEGQRDAYSRAFEFGLMLTLPAAIALLVIPLPLVSILFERGAFGPDDTAATAIALMIYALGLPAFVLQKVLQPLYFAREDTRRPLRYALVSLLVNAGAAVGLAPVLGLRRGGASAPALAAWAMVWFLLWRGARVDGAPPRTLDTVGRGGASGASLLAARAAMGVVLWAADLIVLGPMFGTAWRGLALVPAGALVGMGMLPGAGFRPWARCAWPSCAPRCAAEPWAPRTCRPAGAGAQRRRILSRSRSTPPGNSSDGQSSSPRAKPATSADPSRAPRTGPPPPTPARRSAGSPAGTR